MNNEANCKLDCYLREIYEEKKLFEQNITD